MLANPGLHDLRLEPALLYGAQTPQGAASIWKGVGSTDAWHATGCRNGPGRPAV